VDDAGDPYGIERADAATWLIVDRSAPPGDDAARLVARVEETDEAGVAVTWMTRIPLATSFLTVEMVVEELIRWRERRPPVTRPNPIPHLPPAEAPSQR